MAVASAAGNSYVCSRTTTQVISNYLQRERSRSARINPYTVFSPNSYHSPRTVHEYKFQSRLSPEPFLTVSACASALTDRALCEKMRSSFDEGRQQRVSSNKLVERPLLTRGSCLGVSDMLWRGLASERLHLAIPLHWSDSDF
jgi:hypothetical protein